MRSLSQSKLSCPPASTHASWPYLLYFVGKTCSGAGGGECGLAADPQPRHARRQLVAGLALLVLPRAGWPCFRAGGDLCYADSPTGMNREHAILEASGCMTVNPSDTAPALLVLNAKLVLRSRHGERVINAEDYFVGPVYRVSKRQKSELDSFDTGRLEFTPFLFCDLPGSNKWKRTCTLSRRQNVGILD